MRRLARATATGLATLSASASFAASLVVSAVSVASMAAAAPASASATTDPTPHRAVGRTAVVGTLLLQRTNSAGAATRAVLICETVEGAAGPATAAGYGNVTDAGAACRELLAVDGDFTKLLVHPTWMVPALEAPVTVAVSGTWNSRQATYQRTFRNTGELGRNLGDVFAF